MARTLPGSLSSLSQVLVHRGGERVMVRRPALLLLVPDERREIDDPGDLEVLLRRVDTASASRARCVRRLPSAWQTTSSLSATNSSRSPGSALQALAQRLLHGGRQELLDRRGELVRLDLEPGQALGAVALDELRQLVEPLARELLRRALGVEAAHLAAAPRRRPGTP